MLSKVLTVFTLVSACQAIFPFHHHHHHPEHHHLEHLAHHHHHHHPAISHQENHHHRGPHHPIPIHQPIPIHHPIPFHHHEPIHHHHVPPPPPIHHDHWAFPEYKFAYSVHDHHTGDFHSQHETRHGDHVKGEYELVEPDGRHRKVEYKADDHTGFNAIVHHSSPHHHVHLAHHHHI